MFGQNLAANVPMKKISELFSDEEKKQLSYLGSNLSRPNTPFEEKWKLPRANPALSRQHNHVSLVAGFGGRRPRQLGNPRAMDGDLNA